MGQFSYCCAVCDQEILHGRMPGYQDYTDAAILYADGDIEFGEYDGYGNVGDINVADLGFGQSADQKIMHAVCYTGQTFESLTKGNRHAENQGWWPGERQALAAYGPPDMKDIEHDTRYACLGCHRVWKAKWTGGVCAFGCKQPTCEAHGAVDVPSTKAAKRIAQDAMYAELRALKESMAEEREVSVDRAHTLLYTAPDDLLRRAIEDKHECEACEAADDDLVIPFEERLGVAPNALGICRNEDHKPRDDQSPRKCFAYGQKQVINSAHAECYLCESSEMEIIKVAADPLSHLAVSLDGK